MTLYDELKQLLDEELKLLRFMTSLAEEKTDIILKNDTKALDEITKKEETIIEKMEKVERDRGSLLEAIGLSKDASITEMIEKISDGKEDFLKYEEELIYTLSDLSNANLLNSELIRDNLDWIDFNLNILTNTQVSSGYCKSGEIQTGDTRFDRKV
ncbi:MAG: flagellar protein FlgN [Tissierellia bacterium]|nr:flagellar protein FlgN [Tissierellia bacterium]